MVSSSLRVVLAVAGLMAIRVGLSPVRPSLEPDPAEMPYRVLVFTKTAGFRHESIPDGVVAIRALGATHGFGVDHTEDASIFTDTGLAPYRGVVFISTTGEVLDADQQAAFERYIQQGGGFVGVHAAADTEYDWPWYGGLVGAYFSSHPDIQSAKLHVEDPSDPSTAALLSPWERTDEWYNFRSNPRDAGAHVLLTLDEGSYEGGTMGADHPIAWSHSYDGGRAWYTAGGHTSESFREPLFLSHLMGGIQYAAALPPDGATVLFDGRDTSYWVRAGDGGAPIGWRVQEDGALEVALGGGDVRSLETFRDFRLHVEFWLPATSADAPDQQRSNSGVYLQGRYEIQVLDSFGRSLGSTDGAGAIYGVKDPDVNASKPPETWQTYDVLFRAARFGADSAKTEDARVSLWWNGVLVHDAAVLPGPTAGGAPETVNPGPILLQDHGDRVHYRNIWVLPVS